VFTGALWGCTCVLQRTAGEAGVGCAQAAVFFCFHACFRSRPSVKLYRAHQLDPCAFCRWIQSPACWEVRWWLGRSSRPSASHLEEDYKVKHQDRDVPLAQRRMFSHTAFQHEFVESNIFTSRMFIRSVIHLQAAFLPKYNDFNGICVSWENCCCSGRRRGTMTQKTSKPNTDIKQKTNWNHRGCNFLLHNVCEHRCDCGHMGERVEGGFQNVTKKNPPIASHIFLPWISATVPHPPPLWGWISTSYSTVCGYCSYLPINWKWDPVKACFAFYVIWTFPFALFVCHLTSSWPCCLTVLYFKVLSLTRKCRKCVWWFSYHSLPQIQTSLQWPFIIAWTSFKCFDPCLR